jgi:hypothetical protein
LCVFLWAKGRNSENIYKETFSVHGDKCLPLKAVENWVEKLYQGRSKVADDARPSTEVAETTVKRLVLQVSAHW